MPTAQELTPGILKEAPLGKKVAYKQFYDPQLLYPIPRALGRNMFNIPIPTPFNGMDIWTAHELSWLNKRGIPQVGIAQFTVPCSSENIVEAKSLKLYLNSFNQTMFESADEVLAVMKSDLAAVAGSPIGIKLSPIDGPQKQNLGTLSGRCLDDLEVETSTYHVDANLLKTRPGYVEEAVCSHLLKSNCLITGQPDWGSILIHYHGQHIDHAGLLRYIISYRNHSAFCEGCVEQIFNGIWNSCAPKRLTVYARFTRRGGIEVNPFRSNFENAQDFILPAR